jgi:hypothetical protein
LLLFRIIEHGYFRPADQNQRPHGD